MFQHILFPVDFSERCKQAVPLVGAFARQYRAKVTIMHVVQIPAAWYGGFDAAYPVLFDVEQMEKTAGWELAEFYGAAEGIKPDHEFATKVSHGDPGFEIVQYAAAAQVDLIMMPTHGYGNFRRFLLGSVTSKVLHDAHCPVWTAAHAPDEGFAKYSGCRNMLCAIDRTETSLPIIHRAVELADEFAAHLYLVHAVPLHLDPDVAPPFDSEHYFLEGARKQIDDLQHTAGTNLGVCLAAGDVARVVRDAAVHHSADLIVIGRGRIAERFGGLRTNAYAIIRESPCPVLSV